MATIYRTLLIVGIVLAAQLCACTAKHGRVGVGVGVGDGFSVEVIHRDSVKSPYHDPELSTHARVLAAIQRSSARAAALAHSYIGNGAVSEVVSRTSEFLMVVKVGTPPTRMLAIFDTGSNLVWLKCKPRTAAAPPSVVFDPSSSSTFGRVGCNSAACHALHGASCDARSNCQYLQSYSDGSKTSGLLSTETFTFDSVPGGCPGPRCRYPPNVLVPNITFGCSTSTAGTFVADGVVGLGAGNGSLLAQLAADTTFGRRFSYCLVPYSSKNASSALNFGVGAYVSEPDEATTPLICSHGDAHYTVELESFRIGNASFERLSRMIIDPGTALTFIDKGLLDAMVEELTRRIGLPKARSPEKLLQLCYDVTKATRRTQFEKNVPDVTMYLAVFGVAVTLKAENTFVEVREGTICLAMAPVTKQHPVSILGNIAQQNMHVGYDLDWGTVTFAPADCSSSYNPPPGHS